MFQQPTTSSGYFKPRDHVGELILITEVHEMRQRYDEMKKADTTEAIVDLAVITEDGPLEERVVVSHAGIVNRLTVGARNVLGRIGTTPTKSGHDAYILKSYDDGDDQIAMAWVNKQQGFSQPAAAAPAAPATPAVVPADDAPLDLTNVDPAQLAAALAAMSK